MADGWLNATLMSIVESQHRGPGHLASQSIDGREGWLLPNDPMPLLYDGCSSVLADVALAVVPPCRVRINNGVWFYPDRLTVSHHSVVRGTVPLVDTHALALSRLSLPVTPAVRYRPETPDLFPEQPRRTPRLSSFVSISDSSRQHDDDDDDDRLEAWQPDDDSRLEVLLESPRIARPFDEDEYVFDCSNDSDYVAPFLGPSASYFDGPVRFADLTPARLPK